jgi:starch-binding outer membrane protein, SusD/RagB family
MKTKKYLLYFLAGIFTVISFPACTDLQEEILDETTGKALIEDTANIPNLVVPAYATLRDLWWRQSVWGLEEATSDECMFPTRGGDWFDGGVWVEDWMHTWTPDHRDIRDTWDRLSTGVARANYSLLILSDKQQTAEIKGYLAELRFLRAFYSYYFMDLYGKVPFREYTDQNYTVNPQIFTRQEAFDFIVNEINEILPDLGTKYAVPYGRINQDIAKMLLAKLYLNKEVYTGSAGWQECLQYCDELITSGRYALAANYFDIFEVDNHLNFNDNGEAIFVTVYQDTEGMGSDNNCQWIHPTLHYNQTLGRNFSPWNGCIAPREFFNKIDTANDLRYQDDRIKITTGANLGFLVGQQFNENGDSLKTRKKTIPLNYTPECPLSGAGEEQGVRVMKYEPKIPPVNSARTANDYVVWRIGDVYLMRAEAQFRINGGGLDDLNLVRTQRGLSALGAISAQAILDERGFELYWEGHRRQDLIRFGKFNEARQDKSVTPETNNIFPIPQRALDAYGDKELIDQNPGY